MSLADVIRGAVALANQFTSQQELQQTVSLQRWRAQDSAGKPTYATALSIEAIVDHSARRIRTTDGNETVAAATITFLTPIPPLSPAVSGREEPIDKRDLIVLPTGRTGPILLTKDGLSDPETSRPYVVQVFLG